MNFEAEAKQLAVQPLSDIASTVPLDQQRLASVEDALTLLLQQSNENEILLRQVIELEPLSLAIEEIAVTLQALERVPEAEELGSFMSAILSGSEPTLIAELLQNISEGSNALEELTMLLRTLQGPQPSAETDPQQHSIHPAEANVAHTFRLRMKALLQTCYRFLGYCKTAGEIVRSFVVDQFFSLQGERTRMTQQVETREIVQLLLGTLANLEVALRGVALERSGVEERRKLSFVEHSRKALTQFKDRPATVPEMEMVLLTMQRHIRSLLFLGNVKSYIFTSQSFGNVPKVHTRLFSILEGQIRTLLSAPAVPSRVRQREEQKLARIFGNSVPETEPAPVGERTPEALVTIRSILRGQEIVSRLNPVVQVLGEPAVVFFPCIIQGILTRLEMLFYPGSPASPCESESVLKVNETRARDPHVSFCLNLPNIGALAVDFANTRDGAHLTITTQESAVAAMFDTKIPEIEALFSKLGFSKATVCCEVGPVRETSPEWLTDLMEIS